jgi:HSP20 family protein
MLPATHNNSAMAPWSAPVNRLDRLFDGLCEDRTFDVSPSWTGVPVSLWEDEDHVYIEADLPGVCEQDVELTVHKGMLFIRGERKAGEARQYLYDGRAWGHFERVITLPEKVDGDNVQAELVNGVLRIALPKTPESKPKKIALKTS